MYDFFVSQTSYELSKHCICCYEGYKTMQVSTALATADYIKDYTLSALFIISHKEMRVSDKMLNLS